MRIYISFQGYLETYLRHVNQTIEFKSKLDDLELVSQVEYMGSTLLKDISILVSHVLTTDSHDIFAIYQKMACEHFDKNKRSKLIRMISSHELESDPPNEDASPHLVAVLVDK